MTFREWAQLRWMTAIAHRREARKELEGMVQGSPWYASAEPVSIIQHWSPSIMWPITMCGRKTSEVSSGEIRTVLGWHCRTCHRRVKRALKARKREREEAQS